MNYALYSNVDRESAFKWKHSNTVASEDIFKKALKYNSVHGDVLEFVCGNTFRYEVKSCATHQARSHLFTEHQEHVSELVKQGPLLKHSIKKKEVIGRITVPANNFLLAGTTLKCAGWPCLWVLLGHASGCWRAVQ